MRRRSDREVVEYLRRLHEEDMERIGRLPGEVKVNMAVGMSDVCVRVCAEGVRAQYPGISEEELMEKLRERLEWSKRWRKRIEATTIKTNAKSDAQMYNLRIKEFPNLSEGQKKGYSADVVS